MEGKCGSFARLAFCRYRSSVFGHHVLYVIKSQAESFYIMQVTAGYPVELIEYMWQAGFTDTDSVVGNGDTDPVCLCLCLYGDITRFISRIFYCIIDQVSQHIIEMRTVCKYCNVVRDIYGEVDRLTGLQLVLFNERGNDICDRNRFLFQTECIAILYRKRKDLFDQAA